MGPPLWRTLIWLGIASALSFLTAPNFLTLLNQSLGDTFGTFFPAIPFAALLVVVLSLRWKDFRAELMKERGLSTELAARLVGVGIVVSLLLLRQATSWSVALAGTAVILTYYGTSLALNPSTKRILLPYALLFVAGVTAPSALQWAFGEPLALLSARLSAGLVYLAGIPVVWQGTGFQLASRAGGVVAATVTPGCSSIISVTTFLGLLGLMHIDQRKDASTTLKLAAVGVLALIVLNSVRIVGLIWLGYLGGASAFWEVHNWMGYVLFLGFYVAILPIYSKMGSSR